MGGGGSKQKKKGGKVTSHDQAVLDLKVQRDKLRQYQKRVIFEKKKNNSVFCCLSKVTLFQITVFV